MAHTLRITVAGGPRVDAAKLLTYERNRLGGPAEQRQHDEMDASYKLFGFCVPVFIWVDAKGRDRKYVLDGAGRCDWLDLRKTDGWSLPPIPVVKIQAPNKERAREICAVVASDYARRTQAHFDAFFPDWREQDKPPPFLAAVNLPGMDLDLGTLVGAHHRKRDDPGPAEPPKKPKTRPGDLYVMGEHRLLCGDCTKPEDVTKLLDSATPHLMVTDQPYGVEYDASWREDALGGKRATGKVQNDNRSDWAEAWALFPGEVAYVWHAPAFQDTVKASLEAHGFQFRSQIVWAKSRFAISRCHYHPQHELCFYMVRKGGTGHWQESRKESTLWDVQVEACKTGHSTQKPLELMARPIRNNSEAGDIVYDPFCGSGTTLIAAEDLMRKCYAMEIDPGYCDVIVARWEKMTGQKAERIRK